MIIDSYRYAAAGGGSFPVFLDSTPSASLSGGTVHAVDMPATVNAGDLLLMGFLCNGGGTISTPAGWTERGNIANGGTVTRSAVFEKTAAGTEGGTTVNVTIGASGNAMGRVQRYQAGTFTAGVANNQKTFNSSTSIAPSTLTPAWGALNTAWFVWGCSWIVVGVTTYPLPDDNDNFSGTVFSDCFSTRELNTATLTPSNIVWSASTWGQIHTIGIRPV